LVLLDMMLAGQWRRSEPLVSSGNRTAAVKPVAVAIATEVSLLLCNTHGFPVALQSQHLRKQYFGRCDSNGSPEGATSHRARKLLVCHIVTILQMSLL
jgi:hypothetical protein